MGARGFSGFAAVAIFALFSRSLSPIEYGKFAAGTSLALAGARVAGRGSPTAVLRFLSVDGETDSLTSAALRGWSLRYASYGVAVASLVLFGLTALGTFLPMDLSYVPAATVLMASMTVAEVLSHQLRATGRVLASLLSREVIWRTGLIVFAAAVLAGGRSSNASVVLLVSAGILLVGASVQFAASEGGYNWRSQSAEVAWAEVARRNWGLEVLLVLLPHGSVLAIGFALDYVAAGLLFTSLRLAGLLALPLTALDFVVAPRVSKAWHTRDRQILQRVLVESFAISGPITILSAVFLLVAGERLLGVFGDGVVSSVWPLRAIVAGAVVNALCGPTIALMQMAGQEQYLLRARLLGAGIGFAAIALAGQFGIVFAAVGMALSQVVWNVATVIRARRTLGVDPSLLGVLHSPTVRADLD